MCLCMYVAPAFGFNLFCFCCYLHCVFKCDLIWCAWRPSINCHSGYQRSTFWAHFETSWWFPQVEASRRWRSSNVAKCVCVSVWLFAIVVTYSFLSTAFQHTGCCVSKLLFLTITEFFLPLVIIVVFTLRIMWALVDHRLMQQSRWGLENFIRFLTSCTLVMFYVQFNLW